TTRSSRAHVVPAPRSLRPSQVARDDPTAGEHGAAPGTGTRLARRHRRLARSRSRMKRGTRPGRAPGPRRRFLRKPPAGLPGASLPRFVRLPIVRGLLPTSLVSPARHCDRLVTLAVIARAVFRCIACAAALTPPTPPFARGGKTAASGLFSPLAKGGHRGVFRVPLCCARFVIHAIENR